MAPEGSHNLDDSSNQVNENDVLDAEARERIAHAEVQDGVKNQLVELQGAAEKTRYLAESEKGRLELMAELENGNIIDKVGTLFTVFSEINLYSHDGLDVASFVLLTILDDWLTGFNEDWDSWIHREGEEDVLDEGDEEAQADRDLTNTRNQTGSGYSSRERAYEGDSDQVPASAEDWEAYPDEESYIDAMLSQGKQPYVGRDIVQTTERLLNYPKEDCGLPEGFGPVNDSELYNPDAPYFTFVGHRGTITSVEGDRERPGGEGRHNHGGTDIALPGKTPIVINHPCKIEKVSYGAVNGAYVALKWLDDSGAPMNPTCYFLHMYEVPMHIQAGQILEAHYAIGRVGSTGSSTGNHLHFQSGGYGDGNSLAYVDPGIPAQDGMYLPERPEIDHGHDHGEHGDHGGEEMLA